jgi:hypothetical protein
MAACNGVCVKTVKKYNEVAFVKFNEREKLMNPLFQTTYPSNIIQIMDDIK